MGILDIADRLDREQEGRDEALETSETWVSFSVGGLGFALPVSHLRGAHRVAHITAVPRAPKGLRGLSNLRGRARPVLDLGSHLDIGEVEISDLSRILEVELQGRTLGLLVERAEHLTKILPSTIKPLDDAIGPEIVRRSKGTCEVRDGYVILLDPSRLLTEETRGTEETEETGDLDDHEDS